MSVTGWLDARFCAPLAPERLASVRVLTGAFAISYLLARAPVLASFRHFGPHQFRPVGLASWLAKPLPEPWPLAAYLAAVGVGVAFTLGARFRVSGPAFALLMLWVTSYRNSWGMIFHTDNLLVVHLGVLALTDSAAALSLDARAGARRGARGPSAVAPHARFGWPLRLLCAVTTLAYALAGIAKLKASGLVWMEGEILRNYIAYDALRKAQVGSLYSPLGAWLVQYAWPFPIIGALTMALELLGPLALLQRRAAQLWVLGVYGFHLGVLASMAIAFPYPLSGVAFASFFACERLWELRWLRPLARWLTPTPPDALGGGLPRQTQETGPAS